MAPNPNEEAEENNVFYANPSIEAAWSRTRMRQQILLRRKGRWKKIMKKDNWK